MWVRGSMPTRGEFFSSISISSAETLSPSQPWLALTGRVEVRLLYDLYSVDGGVKHLQKPKATRQFKTTCGTIGDGPSSQHQGRNHELASSVSWSSPYWTLRLVGCVGTTPKKTTKSAKKKTFNELERDLGIIWNNIPQVFIQRMIGSMRRWCQAVVNAQGGHTRYWICDFPNQGL